MNKAKRDSLLGLVFFVGLGLLLWATQELNGISLTPKQVISVRLDNARGLRIGESVFVLGTQSGKVNSVVIDNGDDQRPVLARLAIDSHVKLYKNAVVQVVDSSFLGGKKVSIDPGDGKRWNHDQDQSHIFLGTAPIGPLDALGDVLSGEGNKANLQQVLAGARQFIDDLNAANGSLRKLIEKSDLYDNAAEFLASLAKSATELEKQQSLLGKLIYDKQLGQSAEKAVTDAAKVTDKLTKTDSALGRLINDKALGDKLGNIVTDVDSVTTQLTQSESALGRLINDKALGGKLDTIVDDVATVTKTLNDKDAGLLGALLNDQQLLTGARKIFDDLAKITDDINSGKGALGRLINDEEMGRRLDSMLRQVTRAVEDAREAAPIGTFFQVFSGAF